MARPESVKLLPAYPLAAAARLVGSNPSTLRAWFRGRDYTVGGKKRKSRAVLPTRSRAGEPISFIDLVEAHVFLLIRKQYRIPMKNVRRAAEYLAEIKGSLTFLAHKDFYFDNTHLFLQLSEGLVSLSERGQVVDKDIIEKGLKQVEYGSDGYASEFFPSADHAEQRSFVISPARNFGRLCIARSGVGAEVLAVRFDLGEKIADIAQDYAATPEEVEEAIRWNRRLSPHDRRAA
jgi:uncharacterized protein (DUF433 family)